jgi:hypothetical protein
VSTSPIVLFQGCTRKRARCEALAKIPHTNPFDPRRIDLERVVLDDEFEWPGPTMSPGDDPRVTHRNIGRLGAFARRMVVELHAQLTTGAEASEADRAIYVGIALYFLYDSFDTQLQGLIDSGETRAPFYTEFRAAYEKYLGFLGPRRDVPAPEHLFAILYQLRRAFFYLYVCLRGRSGPVARLRVQVWDAIFTGDLGRYHRLMWNRMHLLPTLIQGPTGTGKELCAEAIGRSGYRAFDTTTMSFAPHADLFTAFNLVSLAPSLVESELFGHKRGAFTGAHRDKRGLLRKGTRGATLFLDEVGEIDLTLQAKLLRVLEDHTFQPVGDPDTIYALEARIVTATHRDLAERIAQGLMGEDFFRRFCVAKIVTPSLRERLDDRPEELRDLAAAVATKLMGGPEETGPVIDEVDAWVRGHLRDHPWTGNVREVAACVGGILLTHEYWPEVTDPAAKLVKALVELGLPLDEIDRRCAVAMAARTGDVAEAARILDKDVRTLKKLLALEPPAPRGPRGTDGG